MFFQRTGSGRLLIAALALAAAAGGATAQAAASDVETGRKLYMHNGCFACHGTVGQGGERGAGPRIAPETYPFEAFKAMVRNPRDAMPAYERRFVSDEQLSPCTATWRRSPRDRAPRTSRNCGSPRRKTSAPQRA